MSPAILQSLTESTLKDGMPRPRKEARAYIQQLEASAKRADATTDGVWGMVGALLTTVADLIATLEETEKDAGGRGLEGEIGTPRPIVRIPALELAPGDEILDGQNLIPGVVTGTGRQLNGLIKVLTESPNPKQVIATEQAIPGRSHVAVRRYGI